LGIFPGSFRGSVFILPAYREGIIEITRSRPIGITIQAILLAIQGGLELIYGLIALFATPGFVTAYGGTAMIQLLATYYPGAALLSMIIPAVILMYFFADRNVQAAFGT
jgi:hypothetical protein